MSLPPQPFPAILCAIFLATAIPLLAAPAAQEPGALPAWTELRSLQFRGGLRAFWNIGAPDREQAEREAVAHGFELVDLLNTYSDYPGKSREKIVPDGRNPWNKPPFFERIIRRNVQDMRGLSIFVHDIEFKFGGKISDLWKDPALRAASKAKTEEEFREAYYREWASWYTLPCAWAKERFPNTPVGIYGVQPFGRDYWGFERMNLEQLMKVHAADAIFWQYIDNAVDFSISSIYCFYDHPASLYYMAANVEENHRWMRAHGNKPVFAYVWLRYHDSNKNLKGRELDDYLVEAMAVLPYFYGARGLVLWGWEPEGKAPYYRTLPLFLRSLGRVADLSDKLGRAEMISEEPVHLLWRAKRPLVRKLRVGPAEWLVLVAYPWQPEGEEKVVPLVLGSTEYRLTVRGKHTEIYHVVEGRPTRIDMMP